MVYNIRSYWVSALCPTSGIMKNTMFWKLGVFPSSGEIWKTPTLLDPLERANITHWTTYVTITTAI
jgi:hypothetical protein